MNNKIYKLARRLKRKYKKIDVQSIISELQTHGYDTVFFNTPKGDELLRAYGLNPGSSRAFTYCGITKVVFVDNALHTSDKICVMLHELGHIELKHIGGNSKYIDSCLSEIEADAYAYSVLNNKLTSKKIIASLVMVILISSLSFWAITTTGQEITPNVTNNDSTVYVTPSGNRYHRQTCTFARRSAATALDIAEAQKCFLPCYYCIGTAVNDN